MTPSRPREKGTTSCALLRSMTSHVHCWQVVDAATVEASAQSAGEVNTSQESLPAQPKHHLMLAHHPSRCMLVQPARAAFNSSARRADVAGAVAELTCVAAALGKLFAMVVWSLDARSARMLLACQCASWADRACCRLSGRSAAHCGCKNWAQRTTFVDTCYKTVVGSIGQLWACVSDVWSVL